MEAFEYTDDSMEPNDWFASSATTDYYNSYTYDKNGNIENLTRNGVSTVNTNMDQFTYNYQTISGEPSNRLGHVDDAVGSGNYPQDIDDQATGNYTYDKLGQLKSDLQEQIQIIEWRYGDKKIRGLLRTSGSTKDELEFVYNPFGQRILKIVKPRPGGVASNQPDWQYYYYAYDANGQVMAVYELKMDPERYKATLDEQHLYGAARLGMKKPGKELYDGGVISYPAQEINQNTLGETYYEISNYLGNVNVVITDRKTVDVGGGATSLFVATELSTSDFYPFGMTMPGREDNVGGYRYGYTGMEMDNEVKGIGNSYNFGARIYDSRIGRWLSRDPSEYKYPQISTYAYCFNSPVLYMDPDGKDAIITVDEKTKTITFKSKIYLVGQGITHDYATRLEEYKNQIFGKDYQSTVDENGQSYTLKFDVEYIIAEEVSYQKRRAIPNVVLNYIKNVAGTGRYIRTKQITGKQTDLQFGDHLFDLDWEDEHGSSYAIIKNSTGLINKNLSVENRAYATVHETLHMFGLDDRYFTIEYNNNCKISESHSLYENDIMSLYNEEKSPDKVEFSQTHVDYLVKGALKTVADKRNIVFIDGKNQFSIFKEILGERHFDDSDPLKEATYERRNTDCPKFK